MLHLGLILQQLFTRELSWVDILKVFKLLLKYLDWRLVLLGRSLCVFVLFSQRFFIFTLTVFFNQFVQSRQVFKNVDSSSSVQMGWL
jgi:hypothetical protein